MKFFFHVFMFLGFAGCGLQWNDVPTATVTPISTDYMDWETEVNAAVDAWSSALHDFNVICPVPFVVGPNGHAVTLIDDAVWEHGQRLAGYTTGDTLYSIGAVEIRNRETEDRTADHIGNLTHELGHALGLGHSDNSLGPSIMGDPINGDHIFPRDAEAAACVLGCGSCDLVDHFDEL